MSDSQDTTEDLSYVVQKQAERIAKLEGAIYEYMQTTDQRTTRERMIGNFVGMYTYRRSNHE